MHLIWLTHLDGGLHSFGDGNKKVIDHIISSYDYIIRSYNATKPQATIVYTYTYEHINFHQLFGIIITLACTDAAGFN